MKKAGWKKEKRGGATAPLPEKRKEAGKGGLRPPEKKTEAPQKRGKRRFRGIASRILSP